MVLMLGPVPVIARLAKYGRVEAAGLVSPANAGEGLTLPDIFQRFILDTPDGLPPLEIPVAKRHSTVGQNQAARGNPPAADPATRT